MSHDDLPVFCSLSAETLATRRADLLSGLARRALVREDVDDGLRLVFAPDAIPAIAAAIDAERRCCRFLRFNMTVEPGGGPVRLTLSGPPGTREFLAAIVES